MNPIDKDRQTTWVGLKAGIFEHRRKLASPGFHERGEVLRNTQDLAMAMDEMSSGNEYPTDRTAQGKKGDNDFVDMRAKYVLRLWVSWTGLYGKAPWPRVRKQWEKI
jgi:hypothetical protein